MARQAQNRLPSSTVILFFHNLNLRRQTLSGTKWVLLILFGVLFFAGYFGALHVRVSDVTVMPRTVLDYWIGFQPWALWPYLSLWVYVVCAPRLAADARELTSYFAIAGGISIIGLAIFMIWPTRTPQLHVDLAGHPIFALLRGADHGFNACPSLHAAFSILTAGWLNRTLKDCRAPRVLLLINALWCTLIVYSTVATNQHVVVDAVAGVALGALGLAAHRFVIDEWSSSGTEHFAHADSRQTQARD